MSPKSTRHYCHSTSYSFPRNIVFLACLSILCFAAFFYVHGMELMEQSDKYNSIANDLYRNGQMDEAIEYYSLALKTLSNKPSELTEPERGALAKYYANRAQANIQLQQFELSVQDCTLAMEMDSSNFKAVVRRGLSYESLNKPALAIQDMMKALTYTNLPSSFSQLALKVKARSQSLIKMEKQRLAEEGVPRDLVHPDQALRLTLQDPLPSTIVLGNWFTVQIRAANEFGLWHRKDFEGKEPVPLTLSALHTLQLDGYAPLTVEVHPESSASIQVDGKGHFDIRLVAGDDEGFERSEYGGICVLFEVAVGFTMKRSFLPVASMPIKAISPHATAKECSTSPEDTSAFCLGCHSCRLQSIPSVSRKVLIAESPGQLGIGGKVWDAGLVLLKWLGDNPELIQGKSIYELGSGTGWVGIGCSFLGGGDVTLTDLEEICPLIELNLQLNLPDKVAADEVRAMPLHWGHPIDIEHFTPPEVVVLSDVVYDPDLYNLLILTLDMITTPETKIYMTHRHRNPEDGKFFDALSNRFHLSEITLSESQKVLSPDVRLFSITKNTNPNRTL